MSASQYLIETDPSRQLVQLTLIGQWQLSTIHNYQRDLQRALAMMGSSGHAAGRYLTLIDLRQQGVQPQEIADEFRALIASHAPLSRRTALVTSGSALHKMQMTRIAGEAERSFFSNKEEALSWLLVPAELAA